MKQRPISIVSADNSVLFQDGLQNFLAKDERFVVVGTASSFEGLLVMLQNNRPDVVIIETMLAGKNGVSAAKYITSHYPATAVLVLTAALMLYSIRDMLHAGAIGYLHKNACKHEITAGIIAAAVSRSYFCKATQQLLLKHYNSTSEKNLLGAINLTEMEQYILQLVCDELPTNDIAQKAGLQKRTVDGYRRRIMRKTGANNITGMIKFAIREGLYEV